MRGLALALAALLSGPALAQTQPQILPPETAVASPGGVDMVKGQYRDESTDLSIGSDGNGGLTFTRVNEKNKPFTSNWHYFLNFECKRSAGPPQTLCTRTWAIESRAISKSYLEVVLGTYSEQGIPTPGVTKLEKIGSSFRFTNADGTLVQFETGSNGDVWAQSMTRKDGLAYAFTYDSGGDPVDGNKRLRRIKSSTGYELILEYVGTGNDRITRACVLNSAITTPPPANSCTGIAQTVSYTYSSFRLATITDPLGKVWSIASQFGTAPFTQTFSKPGVATPWLTNTLAMLQSGNLAPVVTQQAYSDGRTIAYNYEDLDPSLSDPPVVGSETARGIGWIENGTAATALVFQANQQNGESPLFISPAPVQVTDPLGRVTSVAFSGGMFQPHGELLSKTLPNGRKESFGYGAQGQLIQRTWDPAVGFTEAPLTTGYTYDCSVTFNCAKPASMTDPRNAVTNFTYSGTHGGVLTETLPAAQNGGIRPQKRTTYIQATARFQNSAGTFGNGAPVWLVSTVALCRTAATPCAASDETITSFTYPASGTANNLLPLSTSVAAGDGTLVATTSWTYDADGNRLTEDGPLPGTADTSRWRYDVKRRVTGTMSPDPDGAGPLKPIATISTFDDAGRQIKQENGTVNSQATDWTSFVATDREEITYDPLDRKLAAAKKSGATTVAMTHFRYDNFGRLLCTAVRMDNAQWAGQTDACVPQTNGPNGADRITRNSYDLGGQLTKVTEGLGTTDEADEASYAFYPSGKRRFLTDARGFKAEMGYDGHDRQVKWSFPDKVTPGLVSVTDFEQYTLDPNGNRTTLRKRDAQLINYSYDLLNRMTVKDVPGTGTDVGYTYNLLGAQTAATFTTSGQGITSVYDALGRLTSTVTNLGGTSRTMGSGYDLAGNRLLLAGDFGYHAEYTYDTASRMLSYVEGGTVTAVTMAYDLPGRLQTITPASGAVTTYGYDPVSRLASLEHALAGTASDATFTFTYNPASQIASRALTNDAYAYPVAAASKGYAVNGLNQYTAVAGTTHSYDANGNLTGDGTNSYVYDAENRLMSATTATQTVALTYDPLGRLNAVTGSTSGTTRFLYDGDELIREYDGTGTVRNTFVHGIGVDDPLVDYGPGGRRFLHKDHQGSIVALSDNVGNPAAINKYDEFGVPAAGNVGRFGYTGQIWVAELGLWYYKARFYAPGLGRFLQVDPIGYEGGQINLYAYVENDPGNAADPSGTTCTQDQDKGAWTCKIDYVPEGTDPKLVQQLTSAYTAAVNQAMSNPNRMVNVGMDGTTGTRLLSMTRISQGEIGQSLANREIGISLYQTIGSPFNRAETVGQPFDPDNPVKTIIKPRGLSDLNESFASHRRMVRTFLHEGIHGTFGDITNRNIYRDTGYPHQKSYERAAEGITSCYYNPLRC